MSSKQERLLRLHEVLSALGDVARTDRHDILVGMWLSGEQDFFTQVYRDATNMVPGQRIRADVWFVVEKIIDYAERQQALP